MLLVVEVVEVDAVLLGDSVKTAHKILMKIRKFLWKFIHIIKILNPGSGTCSDPRLYRTQAFW